VLNRCAKFSREQWEYSVKEVADIGMEYLVLMATAWNGEVFFDTPLAVCRERNGRRARVVPEDALEKMQERLVAPTTDEGFSRVTCISESEPQSRL